jgi:O-antigen/teichoic acid export membrane protein
VGNLVYAGSQWGILVVLAQIGSPEMVGQFSLSLAITAPIIMFTNLQLRTVQATDAKSQFEFQDYFGLRLISIVIALMTITVVAFTAGYRQEVALVILVMGLAKVFESISDVTYGLIQQNERMDCISKSLMIKGILSIIFVGVSVFLTKSLILGVTGLALARLISLFIYDIPTGASIMKGKFQSSNDTDRFFDLRPLSLISECFRPRWDLQVMTKLAWLSLPLGIVMMLMSVGTNIPRYFIEHFLGERELGIFAAIFYLNVVGGMVVDALAESAYPRLAKHYASSNSKAFQLLLFQLLGIGILLGLFGVLISIFFGKQLLGIIYGAEYAIHSNLLVWIMLVAAIQYISSFLGHGITASRYFRAQIPINLTVTFVTVLTCYFLIPKMGLIGAAISLISAEFVQAVITVGIVLHALKRIRAIQA